MTPSICTLRVDGEVTYIPYADIRTGEAFVRDTFCLHALTCTDHVSVEWDILGIEVMAIEWQCGNRFAGYTDGGNMCLVDYERFLLLSGDGGDLLNYTV